MASQEAPKLNSLSLEYWNDRWNNENIPWHEKDIHPDITKIDFNPKSKIFIPLCGKAVDMRHLAELGHRVVGVEYSERGVVDFFTEQNLKFERSKINGHPDHEIFQAQSLALTIVRGDFFTCGPLLEKMNGGGKFDAIWDRGSHIAINPCDRVKYSHVIKSVVGSECQYYIQGVCYDQTKHAGPPFSLPIEDVRSLYGEDFNISIREECLREDSAKTFKLPWWKDTKYLLTPKSK